MNSNQHLPSRPSYSDPPSLPSQRTGLALHGWKNIAAELDRGVRTVQRWERSLGMPVHRISKGARSPVFAFADELHFWLRKNAEAHDCAPLTISDHLLQQQKKQAGISNWLSQPTFGEGGRGTRQMAQSGNLYAIINFLAAQASRPLAGNCKQCHSPLRSVEAHFWIPGTKSDWIIPLVFCPVCDLETIGSLGATQTMNLRPSARNLQATTVA
jgi:hypothetical protein